MQIMKDKKLLKEARKEVRQNKAALNSLSSDKYTGNDDSIDHHEDHEYKESEVTTIKYDDKHKESVFQGEFTIKIGTGIADDLDDRYGNPFKGDDDDKDDEEEEEDKDKNEDDYKGNVKRGYSSNLIDDDETNLKKWQEKQRLKAANEPSNFEKAMKIAKIKMGKGKGHSTGTFSSYIVCFIQRINI